MPQTNSQPNQTNIQRFNGHLPNIASGVYVHASATIIGQVNLGENVSVWPGVVIRGDINFIHIGAGSNIQDCAVLHVNHQSIHSRPRRLATYYWQQRDHWPQCYFAWLYD